MAEESEPPTPPPIPEGMDIKLSADAPCPEMPDGGRPNCGEGLCCGTSVKEGEDTTSVDTCRDSTSDAYEKDGANWQFTCLDARSLLASIAAMTSIAITNL